MVKSVLATALLLIATISAARGTLVIESVNLDSPAAAAGAQTGDRILRLDGRKIATVDDLKEVMGAHQLGDTVPLTVERDGETVGLTLTFGGLPGGGVSIGVGLSFDVEPGGDPSRGEVECLAWIDRTYRIESMMQDLELDLSDAYETARACTAHDARRMAEADAIRYCDNVFKVHCSGLDLLLEIGEAQVRQCEEQLSGSLGLRLGQYKGWKTCGKDKVFDRYSKDGEPSDADSCKAAFLDECGSNIDSAIKASAISTEQRDFVDCCTADALDMESRGESGRCRMIDDGFVRGPCHDRPVCINRLTSEWIDCAVLR